MKRFNEELMDDEDINLFGECELVIKTLEEKRILSVYLDCEKPNTFRIKEMCDEWFGMELTAEMCEDLAVLFTKIGNKIKGK